MSLSSGNGKETKFHCEKLLQTTASVKTKDFTTKVQAHMHITTVIEMLNKFKNCQAELSWLKHWVIRNSS